MANIREKYNKDGKLISFLIRVYRGRGADGKQLKPYTETFKIPANSKWSEKTARKKAAEYAAILEKECKEGIRTDTRQTFSAYCDYVIELKESRGVKHSTIVRYKELTKRIYEHIGQIKLKDLRADHLNTLITALSADGVNKRTGGKLSAKTIKEYHRLISTVLEQAVKEGLIPHNVAKRVETPKVEKKEVNYFQPDEVARIREACEQEPIKWKTLTHLFLITGARRGEILGLKWDKVDFDNNTIKIDNTVLYSSDIGVYEDTPKTPKSKRTISLPNETMLLLRQYRKWQLQERLRLGAYYENKDFVFAKDDGNVMHPDSVVNYFDKFSRKYNLPHINAHAFRHTMASMLYFNGVDTISISSRLGHAQPSTTADIYSHVIEKADEKNAEILANVFLKQA